MKVMILAALALASCGDRAPEDVYEGSTTARAVVVSYIPEGPDEEMDMAISTIVPPGGSAATYGGGMVINTGPSAKVVMGTRRTRVKGTPPRVMLGVQGGEGGTYDLPRGCPPGPILSREGRIVHVRVDRWRRPDGTKTVKLSPDEVAAAMCGDFVGRDEKVSRHQTASDEDLDVKEKR